MTLTHMTPSQRYQHIDGRKVIGITELKVPFHGNTHLIHYSATRYDYWDELQTFIIEIPQERWQGLRFNTEGYVRDFSMRSYNSTELLKGNLGVFNYTHAINLSTHEIVKL